MAKAPLSGLDGGAFGGGAWLYAGISGVIRRMDCGLARIMRPAMSAGCLRSGGVLAAPIQRLRYPAEEARHGFNLGLSDRLNDASAIGDDRLWPDLSAEARRKMRRAGGLGATRQHQAPEGEGNRLHHA